jgi:hypothetical protein
MQACFKLYEVSLYLASKLESASKSYKLSQELKGFGNTEFITKPLTKKQQEHKQRKYERNLKLI